MNPYLAVKLLYLLVIHSSFSCYCFVFLILRVGGIELRALRLLSKCSTFIPFLLWLVWR
jgi:hypothetical protein